MNLKAENTIAKVKNGKFVIAFTVSPDEHRDFIEWAGGTSDFFVSLEPYFGKATKGQKDFFHRYLRKLSEKMRMSFEETKIWFVTEYGCVEEDEEGNYNFLILPSNSNAPGRFKEGKYYFKEIDENPDGIVYLTYKGISMLNSREMNLMLDYLKQECEEQGIKVLSDTEYEKLKARWGT